MRRAIVGPPIGASVMWISIDRVDTIRVDDALSDVRRCAMRGAARCVRVEICMHMCAISRARERAVDDDDG